MSCAIVVGHSKILHPAVLLCEKHVPQTGTLARWSPLPDDGTSGSTSWDLRGLQGISDIPFYSSKKTLLHHTRLLQTTRWSTVRHSPGSNSLKHKKEEIRVDIAWRRSSVYREGIRFSRVRTPDSTPQYSSEPPKVFGLSQDREIGQPHLTHQARDLGQVEKKVKDQPHSSVAQTCLPGVKPAFTEERVSPRTKLWLMRTLDKGQIQYANNRHPAAGTRPAKTQCSTPTFLHPPQYQMH